MAKETHILRRRSFTLIELLIVSLISSIMILSLYSALHTGILSYRKIDSAFNIYQEARTILNKMELDLKNSYIYSQKNSKFSGQSRTVSFFTIVDSYKKDYLQPNICHIKYVLENTILKRVCQIGQDALKEDLNQEGEELSSKVKEINFQYAYLTSRQDSPYSWQEFWPKEEAQKIQVPLAVKIKLLLIGKDNSDENVVEFTKIVVLPLAD